MKQKYHLIRRRLYSGGYLTIILELPGCFVVSRSLIQEEKVLPQVIAAYLALAAKTGIQLPSEEIYTVSLINLEINNNA